MRSNIYALDNILKRRRGQEEDEPGLLNPKTTITRPPHITSTASLPISEAARGYLAAKGGDWITKTYGQVETSLRLFCDHVGADKDLSEVTRLDVTNWRERMRRLRPRWASSSASKGLPLDELLAISWPIFMDVTRAEFPVEQIAIAVYSIRRKCPNTRICDQCWL